MSLEMTEDPSVAAARARRLERRSIRQGAASASGAGGEDGIAPLQSDAPVPAPAAGGASPSRRRSVLRAERGMLGQSRESTTSGLEAGGFEEGAGGENNSSGTAGSGSSPKSGEAIDRNASFDPFAAVEQDDGELTSLVSAAASPRRRRRFFGRRSGQEEPSEGATEGSGAGDTGNDDGGTGAAAGGNARDSSRVVPPQLRYAAERDDPNAPGPVLWHPQRLAKAAQQKLGPLAVGGVGMGRPVPPIAVSPRLQDAALGQSLGLASAAAPKRWGWLSGGRGLASSDGEDGVASDGGERLSTAAAAAAAAQTTVGWTGSEDGISSYGRGAAVLTNQQPAVTRLLSSGSLRERMVRDLVALASQATAQVKSTGGDQSSSGSDENKDGQANSDGTVNDSSGIAALRAAGEAQRALADLRRRGFATLDDVLDDDGVLLGCEDPVIPHAVRLCRATDDLPDGDPYGGAGDSRHRNSNGSGGFAGGGASPPPPPLGSGHRPTARVLGPGRATVAPQVVMRSPTTGVGPSTQSEGHRHSVELAVRVLKLAVHDHPLFCHEDRLALLLRQAHSAYVTELERDPCRYLALRLAAAVHELQRLVPQALSQSGGRDQGRREEDKDASSPEEDPALAKLVALAYPNSGLHAGPGFGFDQFGSNNENNNSSSNAADGNAGIPTPASAADKCELLWRDACDTLSSLLDAETAARQTTKRVYRLWRALQAARRDAAASQAAPGSSNGNNGATSTSGASSQKSKSTYFKSRRGSSSDPEQTPVNGGVNSETNASGNVKGAPRAVCATPLRLRLTARSPAAVANGCVDVLPAVEALSALHDRLAKISMALVHKRFRRDTQASPAAPAAPPAMTSSGAAPTRRSERRRRSGPNASGLEGLDTTNEGAAPGQGSKSGDEAEQVGYREARREARERHDAVKKLLATSRAFFAGEVGDGASASSTSGGTTSRKGSGTKEARKGSRRTSLDMAVDSSVGGGSNPEGAIGVGAGRFAFLLVLSHDGEKTPLPMLSMKERRRRHRLARAGFYVMLCVNDPEDAIDCSGSRKVRSGCWGCCGSSSSGIGSSSGSKASRSSSFTTQKGMATRIRIPAWGSVPFSDVDLKVVEFKGVGEEVRLQVRHRPHNLSLRLYARGGGGSGGMGSGDTLLACVPLPLPGRGSALEGASPGALAADARWYQWACAAAMKEPQSALWLGASKAVQQQGWLQTLALTLRNCSLPKPPMRWSLSGGAEEGTENDPDHGAYDENGDENDDSDSRRSDSRAAGAEALRAAAGEENGDSKASRRRGSSDAPPPVAAEASDSLLGARRRERTDVEAALVAKLLPGPRHCHGSVMVAARWELSPVASAAAHARLAARAAAGGRGGGMETMAGESFDGILGEALPDEKTLLEDTPLVGRRLSRPWDGTSDPAHFPVPSFVRESDFVRSLPKPGTTDPFDLASRSVRRHQSGMYDYSAIASSGSSTGRSSSGRGSNPSAFNLHVGEVAAGFFGVPAHVNANGRVVRPGGSTGGGFGNVNLSSSSDWPLNASHSAMQLPPLSLLPLGGVGGSSRGHQGLRRRSLANQELFAEPPRHTLLRARQRRPDASLFLRRPIPLNDSEVAASEAYRPLLVAVAKSESSQDLTSPISAGAMSSSGGPLASPQATSGSLLGTVRLAGLASALGQAAIMSPTSIGAAPSAPAAVDVASGAVLRSSKVENFARRVRDSRLAAVHARKRRAPLPLRRVVKEALPEDIDLGGLIDFDDLMPQPARKLRPNALSPAAAAAAAHAAGNDAGGGVPERLILTVVAADNVPTRMASTLPFNRDAARYQRLGGDNPGGGGVGGGSVGGRRQQAGSGRDLQASNNSFGGAGFESVAALLMDEEDDDVDREALEFESGRVRGVVEAALPHTGANAATAVCPGRAPHWRETLVLDLNLPGDSSNRDGLGSGGGGGGMGAGGAVVDPAAGVLGDGRELVLSLFDEVLERDPNGGLGGRLQGHSQHRWRAERRFLGSVRVPLASLAATGRLEGTLKLETPDVNLGYNRSDATKPRNGRRGAAQRQQQGYYDQLGDAAAGLGAAFGFSAGGFGSGALGGGSGTNDGSSNGNGNSPAGASGNTSGDFGSGGGGGSNSSGGGLDAPLLASPAENTPAALRKRADAATYLRVAIVLDPPPTAAAQAAATATIASKSQQSHGGGGGEGDSDYRSSSNETAALAAHARSWLDNLHFEKSERAHVPSAMPPDRRWEVLAPNLEGDLVFVCRFLRPGGLAPPPSRAFPRSPSITGSGSGNSSGFADDSFDESRVGATMGRSRRSRRSARASLAAADQLNASATLAGVSGSDVENSTAVGSGQDVCTVAAAARFVALLPFLEDYLGFRDLDLWCTCGQFLEVLAGDWEEHALLLWHYLVYLQEKGALDEPRTANNDQPSSTGGGGSSSRKRWTFYLVIGRAVPSGDAQYVLQLDQVTGDAVIWDARSGEAFDASDTRLPLVDITVLATPDNCWANIQREGRPADLARQAGYGNISLGGGSSSASQLAVLGNTLSAMSGFGGGVNGGGGQRGNYRKGRGFDVDDPSKWKPFFPVNLPAAKKAQLLGSPGRPPTVQEARLVYPPPLSYDDCRELATRIQDRLRDAITSWRTASATSDHRAYPVFAPDTRAKILLQQLEHRKLGQWGASNNSSSSSGGGGGSGGNGGGEGGDSGNGGAAIIDLRAESGSQRECFGVTLNCSYTDMAAIEERVKATGVHATGAADVLFMLAVHVVPYPCKVLSVWVFVGSMPRNSY